MTLELVAPCCLHLGFARADDGALCELGIALRYPPIQLSARPAEQLFVSGARSELAYRCAATLDLAAEIEIELAIPALMGLGSDEMMRESVARLAPTAPARPMDLFAHAFDQGGLLVVDRAGNVIARASVAHVCEEDEWVFVLVLPKEVDDAAASEANRRLALREAVESVAGGMPSARMLFDAAGRDDFHAWADAMRVIHEANEAALRASGELISLSAQEQKIVALMQAEGAAFAGRALSGLAMYGLIRGGAASRRLRRVLTEALGYFGPTVMASICDERGARIRRPHG